MRQTVLPRSNVKAFTFVPLNLDAPERINYDRKTIYVTPRGSTDSFSPTNPADSSDSLLSWLSVAKIPGREITRYRTKIRITFPRRRSDAHDASGNVQKRNAKRHRNSALMESVNVVKFSTVSQASVLLAAEEEESGDPTRGMGRLTEIAQVKN